MDEGAMSCLYCMVGACLAWLVVYSYFEDDSDVSGDEHSGV